MMAGALETAPLLYGVNMASQVSICNLALAHIGQPANLSSLDEQTYEADLCNQFHPISLGAILESHAWNFITRRISLALLDETMSQWEYVYAMPADCLNVIAILPPESADDYSESTAVIDSTTGFNIPLSGTFGCYVGQPFQVEMVDMQKVILTNQSEATCRYTSDGSDSSLYPSMFVMALSHDLASKLAGPIIKGTEGMTVARAQMALAMTALSAAKVADCSNRMIKPRHNVPLVAAR